MARSSVAEREKVIPTFLSQMWTWLEVPAEFRRRANRGAMLSPFGGSTAFLKQSRPFVRVRFSVSARRSRFCLCRFLTECPFRALLPRLLRSGRLECRTLKVFSLIPAFPSSRNYQARLWRRPAPALCIPRPRAACSRRRRLHPGTPGPFHSKG